MIPSSLAGSWGCPWGAIALSGVAVPLLLFGWLFVYLAIYLPRGMVG